MWNRRIFGLALNHVLDDLTTKYEKAFGKPKDYWNFDEITKYREKIKEIASNNFFGFVINPDLVKSTKMNMVMNNDGAGNTFSTNTLLLPHEWKESFRNDFAKAVGVSPDFIKNHKNLEFFDVIVSNPPFGADIPIDDPHILEQFDLARIWEKEMKVNSKTGKAEWTGRWLKTDRLRSSIPPEILFIERNLQLLKKGGRMGIVLPDSILGSPGMAYIRQWLIEKTKIVGSVDLHADIFQPRNGTQTSVLFLEKPKDGERIENNYQIFMAIVEHVGHDKRGNPLFIRDEHGQEVYFETDLGNQERKLDDQTPDVVEAFNKWKNEQVVVW